MCYLTLLSTTSDADLSLANTPSLRFSTALPGIPEERYLRFAHRWYVGSQAGCSCEFRHLHAPAADFDFCEPVDWYAESAEMIDGTRRFAAVVRDLVRRGERVDCVDAWAHGTPDPAALAGDIEVDLTAVPDASFRFFENQRFSFAAS